MSATVLALVFANEHRRIGRNEVRHLLARRSLYGPSLSAVVCGDLIVSAVTSKDFEALATKPLSDFVIDHYVDYGFNVKLYNHIATRLRHADLKISTDDIEKSVAIINSWRSQCADIEKLFNSYVRGYEGVEKELKFRKAIRFLDRRKKYFEGVFDNFIVDVKDATIAAMSQRLI